MIKYIKRFFKREKNRIKDPVIKLILLIDRLNLEDLKSITNYSIALRAFKERLER